MVHSPASTTSPADEYEHRLAHRREAATFRLTNIASLALVFTPLALGLLGIALLTAASGRELVGGIIVTLIAALPAGISGVCALYDWPVLTWGKRILGLTPWTLLALGTTWVLLAIFR